MDKVGTSEENLIKELEEARKELELKNNNHIMLAIVQKEKKIMMSALVFIMKITGFNSSVSVSETGDGEM